ncbi:hypothetical protein QCA50_015340 [Cerrena zonata]|uniref:Uncharacterized protein n=1 Tax=Cerrena zonata TaxID=2478898 RepID=A0AAW0FN77_9APHY
MAIPLNSECIGDGTSSFSVDWISDRLACYVRLKEGLEFLNINASFLTLLKGRHIPKPTVNIRPVMKLASLLLTIAAYKRKENIHTIEFLTWFMASCNLDHLKRITLNFPRYGIASAPMDGLLLKDVIDIINLITKALPEEKRRLGTAIILDCRSWSTPLEDEYHASLAENPEEQPFTIRLSGLHKDYFLYLLHDYAVKTPKDLLHPPYLFSTPHIPYPRPPHRPC